jgi:putative ABC transport system ATP-binding protein
MERTEVSSQDTRELSFPAQITIVLLVGFAVIELASFMGWSTSVTSTLTLPTNQYTNIITASLSLLAALGIYAKAKAGAYLALSLASFMIIVGVYSLYRAQTAPQLSSGLTASSVGAVFSGFLILTCVFKADLHMPGVIEPTQKTVLLDNKRQFSTADRFAIETNDVTKKYFLGPNVVSAVNGLTMKVQKGEFIAIMGPSGSGKSTLLNLLGALDKPSSGKILIDGVDISGLNENQLARLRNEKVGFVFQAYNLVSRSSVLRNMELPALVKGYSRSERERRVKGLLAVVGLSDKITRQPKTLSGGEQQRVAIARALINDPEIVLADEPTGNVDSRTGRMIMDFLRKLNKEGGTTVIVVTHSPDVANMVDRIIYIRDGQISRDERGGGISA